MGNPTPAEIIWGAIVPGAIALIVLLGAWQPWSRQAPVERANWSAPVGMGLAFLFGYLAINLTLPAYPPAGFDNFFYLAAALMIVATIDAFWPPQYWLRSLIALLVIAAAAFFMFRNDGGSQWDTAKLKWVAVVAGFIWLLWNSNELFALRHGGLISSLALMVAAIGISMVVGYESSRKSALLGGMVVAGMGAAVLVGALHPKFSTARGGVTFILVISLLLLLKLKSLAQLQELNVELVGASLVLPWLVEGLPKKFGRWPRAIAAIVLAAVPAAIAAVRAHQWLKSSGAM